VQDVVAVDSTLYFLLLLLTMNVIATL